MRSSRGCSCRRRGGSASASRRRSRCCCAGEAADGGGCRARGPASFVARQHRAARRRRSCCVHVMARGSLWSPYYKITVGQEGPDTVVEVNNIFHQSMAPVEQKEYFYQWPYMVFGDTFENVLVLGAGSGTDVAAALRHGAKHVDAVEIDPVIVRLGRQHHPDHPVLRSARHGRHRRRAAFPADDDEEVRPRRLRADRFADDAVELLGRAARELHVHGGVVPRRPRSARAGRPARRLQLLPRAVAGRSAGEHRGRGVRAGAARARARGARVPRRPDGRSAARDADGRSGDSRPGHGVRAVARAEPGADARRAMPASSRRPTTGRSSTCTIATSRATTSRRWPSSWSSRRVVVLVVLRGQAGSVVVAVLPARRRLHAARDEVDHPVRAAVGLDVGRRVAGDRVGAVDGARRQLRGVESRDPPAVARRGGARSRLLALNYLIPVGTIGFESRVVESLFYAVLMFSPILCAGLLFGSAIKRSTSLAARLRHEPARCDGRRRRRVSVARHRLPRAAPPHRALLRRRDRRKETLVGPFARPSNRALHKRHL